MWFPSLSALWHSASSATPRGRRSSGRARSKPCSSRLTVEALEERSVPATLSVSDAYAVEGGMMAFTVTLSEPLATTVSVRYDTADGSAVSKANGRYSVRDYDAQHGTLTFAAGETSKTVFIQTSDDARNESVDTEYASSIHEFFYLNLTQARGATIFDGTGEGLIEDNDYEPYSTYDPYYDPYTPYGIY